MALDPSIPLSVKPPSINTPFESLGQLLQLRNEQQRGQLQGLQIQGAQSDLADKQRARQEHEAFVKVMSDPTLRDPDALLDRVRTDAPSEYAALSKLISGQKKDNEELKALQARTGASNAAAAVDQQKFIGQSFRRVLDTVGDSTDPVEWGGSLASVLATIKQSFPNDATATELQTVLTQPGGFELAQKLVRQHAAPKPTEQQRFEAERPKIEADAAVAQQVAAGTVGGLTPVQQETAKNEGARIGLQRERLQFDKNKDNGAASPVGADLPLDTSPGLHPDVLKKVPAPVARAAMQLQKGMISLPARFAKGDTFWQSVLDTTIAYDPSFDGANYNARAKARADFMSPNGRGAQQIAALNTALQHTGVLSDVIDREGNTNYPAANAVYNALRTAGGSTKVTNFKTIAPQQLKEIEGLWSKSGGNLAEIQQLNEAMAPNMGYQQQREALAGFMTLLKGKLDTMISQRNAVMGEAASEIPIIYPENQAILDRILGGGSSSSSGAAKSPTPSQFKVTVIKP